MPKAEAPSTFIPLLPQYTPSFSDHEIPAARAKALIAFEGTPSLYRQLLASLLMSTGAFSSSEDSSSTAADSSSFCVVSWLSTALSTLSKIIMSSLEPVEESESSSSESPSAGASSDPSSDIASSCPRAPSFSCDGSPSFATSTSLGCTPEGSSAYATAAKGAICTTSNSDKKDANNLRVTVFPIIDDLRNISSIVPGRL